MSTHSELLDRVRTRLVGHNEKIGEDAKVDVEATITKITDVLGGTSVESLKLIEASDLVDDCGLPKLLAREIVKILQDQGDTQPAEVKRPKAWKESEASEATDEQLVAAYDPDKAGSAVAKELRSRAEAHGEEARFVVFDRDGRVHQKATLELLQELREGHPPRDTYALSGSTVEVHRVGEKPAKTFHEHPLYPGVALRGQQDDAGRDWIDSIKLETRYILRLAVTSTGELRITSNDQVTDIYRRSKGDEGLVEARERYPQAAAEYTRRHDLNDLPPLRVSKARGGRRGGRSGDPLNLKQTY
jgi:hypothetical protein